MGSLEHAGGCFVDLHPQARVQKTNSAVLNITCKIFSPSSCTPTPPESVQEFGSEGQGVTGAITEEALYKGVTSENCIQTPQDHSVTSEHNTGVKGGDNLQMYRGPDVLETESVALRSDSDCCFFYIARQMIETPANLWPYHMLKVEQPRGLPLSPLTNYYIMGYGWDWEKKAYEPRSIAKHMDKMFIPTDCAHIWHAYTMYTRHTEQALDVHNTEHKLAQLKK